MGIMLGEQLTYRSVVVVILLTTFHTSPGRFFAVSQMKALLAYLIVNYDIKFADDGKRPSNLRVAFNVLPALDAQVMFRARQF